MAAFAFHFGSSLATFSLSFLVLEAASFDYPALAVAGVVSRLTKRFRMPLDMSLAAALAHVFPWTNQLKLGPMLALPMQQRDIAAMPRVSSLLESMQGPVNKYGFALLPRIASRHLT